MGHLLTVIGEWIKGVIASGGYAGVVLLMALESACVPLPSEVIMPFAGALTTTVIAQSVHRAPMSLHGVALAGALGCALGSALAWVIGIRGGREFALRYGRYLLIRPSDVRRGEKWFERHGPAAVFFSRLLPIVRTFISLPAGIARMPFAPFVTLSFLGSVPWCYLLAYIGVQFAYHLDDLKKYFHGADLVIGIVLAAAIGVYIWHHLRQEPDEPEAAAPAA